MSRWAWAEIDVDAIRHNVHVLRGAVAPSEVWAVVKADGYGHGAVDSARAALRGGATGLAVALVQEGAVLRAAGIEGRVLVLSEQPPDDLADAVRLDLELTVYSTAQVRALEATDAAQHPVHLKVDSGMHRVGARSTDAVAIADAIEASPAARLAAVWTHLAIADNPADPYTAEQLARFDVVLDDLAVHGHRPPMVHAANSAGGLAHPCSRRSMVRAGIAVYGIPPGRGVTDRTTDLRPAMSLHARVSHVQRVDAGDRISYGLRHTFPRPTTVATLPIGYADGVPRRLHAVGGEVLLGGRRRPIVGVVTMDQLMIDCGDDTVAIGDHAVLIGRQGDQEVTAVEWADRLETIAYEVVCGISPRVGRRSATSTGQ